MARLRLAFVLCVSLIFSSAVFANADMLGPQPPSHARLGRLIKKRASPGLSGLLGGSPQGGQGTSSTPSNAAPSSSDSPATPTSSPSPTASSVASPSPSSSAGENPLSLANSLLSSQLGGLLPTDSSSATPTSTTDGTASSTVHASTSASTTQGAAATTPSSQQKGQQSSQQSPSIYYVTAGSSSTPTQSSEADTSSGLSHTALTVLIIIAVSVGASTIVWTIIRKWKFRPSSNFEDRMQPIDWQPGKGEDGDVAGSQRRLSDASSFHSRPQSSEDHKSGNQPGSVSPVLDHDFTPGAHPVGGYANLARGHSPQPMMQQAYPTAPPPTWNNGPCDQYGVPLHYGYGTGNC